MKKGEDRKRELCY